MMCDIAASLASWQMLVTISLIFRPGKRVSKCYERCSSSCYHLSVLSFFIPRPIGMKPHTQIGDNIIHNRTMSDFQVMS